MFNQCLFRLILAVYFCFTAAFDLTVASSSAADLFICCTPAVFPKARLPQSFQAVRYNLPQSTFLFSFLPFNSPKVQGTIFQLRTFFQRVIYIIFKEHYTALPVTGESARAISRDYCTVTTRFQMGSQSEANSGVQGHLLRSCTPLSLCCDQCSDMGISKMLQFRNPSSQQMPAQSATASMTVT